MKKPKIPSHSETMTQLHNAHLATCHFNVTLPLNVFPKQWFLVFRSTIRSFTDHLREQSKCFETFSSANTSNQMFTQNLHNFQMLIAEIENVCTKLNYTFLLLDLLNIFKCHLKVLFQNFSEEFERLSEFLIS